jgi:hypothetical protein
MESLSLSVYFETAKIWHDRTGRRLYQLDNPGLHSAFGTLADIRAFTASHYGQDPEAIAHQYIDTALESSNASWMA